MPRCCSPRSLDPCYASVLVCGKTPLSDKLWEMEDQLVCPSVTAWCPRCKHVSTLTSTMGLFPTPSAHFAHLLTLHPRMEVGLPT